MTMGFRHRPGPPFPWTLFFGSFVTIVAAVSIGIHYGWLK